MEELAQMTPGERTMKLLNKLNRLEEKNQALQDLVNRYENTLKKVLHWARLNKFAPKPHHLQAIDNAVSEVVKPDK